MAASTASSSALIKGQTGVWRTALISASTSASICGDDRDCSTSSLGEPTSNPTGRNYLPVMSMAQFAKSRCFPDSTLNKMYRPLTSFGTATSVVHSAVLPAPATGTEAMSGL